jgi:tetratricopeptide (TPR) repeat protein
MGMPRAVVVEEHSSVLPQWFEAGLAGATVVYLDAHLDLQFVEPARVERLRQCASAVEMARWESRHPLSPHREACYGIEDFLFPAACLGLIRRVIWIAPPHVLRAGIGSALQGLLQMEGVTPEQLESFHRKPGGWIEGHLLGLDLVIGELQQLVQLPLQGDDVVVDIDTDYFVSVPGDTVWAQPRDVIAALKQWVGHACDVTIARSVGTGFLPLRHRFIADHLAALWEGRTEDAAHWQCLFDLLPQTPNRGDTAYDLPGLQALHARRPGCAATCHALALATDGAQERARYLEEAAALDPFYADDLIRRLGEFRARWKRVDMKAVLGLHREAAALEGSSERRATAWIALGLLYAAFGRPHEARACDEQSVRHSAGHPDLALAIARLHIARAEFDEASPFLARAVMDDETRVVAWRHLAECALAMGDLAAARDHCRAARAAAPAWPGVLKQLAAIHDALAEPSAARSLRQQCDDLETRMGRVISRLG